MAAQPERRPSVGIGAAVAAAERRARRSLLRNHGGWKERIEDLWPWARLASRY